MAGNEIFHERQSLQLCALHLLNNLFQGRTFSKAELDAICMELTPNAWLNPHRSMFGLGNYDVNVIMSALQRKGYEAKWFDKRRLLSSLVLENIFGFILNVPGNYKVMGLLPLPFKQRHWIALKKIQVKDAFYNLDSVLKGPEVIGPNKEFLTFLQNELASDDKELLVVVTRNVAEAQSWKRGDIPQENANAAELSN